MDVRVIRGADVLDRLGSALDDLLDAVAAPIMARRPWLQTWVRCYRDHEPWAVVVEEGGRLRAAALLATRRRARIAEVVRMGHGATDHARLPAGDPEAAARLGDGVAAELRARRGPWMLSLGQLPVGDRALRRIEAALRCALVQEGDGSPTLRFRRGEPFTAHVSRNYRKNLRYAAGRARKAGLAIEVSHLREPDAVARVLPATESIRRERDREKGRADRLSDPRYASFRREAIAALAGRGEVELTTLNIEGELAAYAVALLDGDAYRWWDGRFSPAWAHVYAGRLLMDAILRRAFDDPRFSEFDLMRGRLDYKLWVASEVVPAETLVAWSSPAVRAAVGSAGRIRHAMRAPISALRR